MRKLIVKTKKIRLASFFGYVEYRRGNLMASIRASKTVSSRREALVAARRWAYRAKRIKLVEYKD